MYREIEINVQLNIIKIKVVANCTVLLQLLSRTSLSDHNNIINLKIKPVYSKNNRINNYYLNPFVTAKCQRKKNFNF